MSREVQGRPKGLTGPHFTPPRVGWPFCTLAPYLLLGFALSLPLLQTLCFASAGDGCGQNGAGFPLGRKLDCFLLPSAPSPSSVFFPRPGAQHPGQKGKCRPSHPSPLFSHCFSRE